MAIGLVMVVAYLLPAILVLKISGVQDGAFDMCIHSPIAWVGSGIFWIATFFVFSRSRNRRKYVE